MKKEAIGSITKVGGFSRLVREVHDSKEPVQIIRNNEIVAMVVPANSDMVEVFEHAMNFGKALRGFSDIGTDIELHKYLLGQILTGHQAQALLRLLTGVDADIIKVGEQGMIDAINNALQKELKRRESE